MLRGTFQLSLHTTYIDAWQLHVANSDDFGSLSQMPMPQSWGPCAPFLCLWGTKSVLSTQQVRTFQEGDLRSRRVFGRPLRRDSLRVPARRLTKSSRLCRPAKICSSVVRRTCHNASVKIITAR